MPFLDTNILVYTVVRGVPRQPRAERLLYEGGLISAQVLNEFASVASRKLGMRWDEIERAVGRFRQLCPRCVPLTAATNAAALALCGRNSFAFYDALIVASALEAGCDVLFTEDLSDGLRVDDRLTIRNPFACHGNAISRPADMPSATG